MRTDVSTDRVTRSVVLLSRCPVIPERPLAPNDEIDIVVSTILYDCFVRESLKYRMFVRNACIFIRVSPVLDLAS